MFIALLPPEPANVLIDGKYGTGYNKYPFMKGKVYNEIPYKHTNIHIYTHKDHILLTNIYHMNILIDFHYSIKDLSFLFYDRKEQSGKIFYYILEKHKKRSKFLFLS